MWDEREDPEDWLQPWEELEDGLGPGNWPEDLAGPEYWMAVTSPYEHEDVLDFYEPRPRWVSDR